MLYGVMICPDMDPILNLSHLQSVDSFVKCRGSERKHVYRMKVSLY